MRLARGTTALFLLLFACTQGAQGTTNDALPMGHKDFLPSPARPVGWRGDGTGCFPGATPVISWDTASGSNVCWTVPMPNASGSSPIVIGNRVITMVEPHTILCLDARTGALLWFNATDQLDILCQDAREAAQIRTAWELYPTYFVAVKEWQKPRERYLKTRKESHRLEMQKAEVRCKSLRSELAGLGVQVSEPWTGEGQEHRYPEHFWRYGLYITDYRNCIGRTFPTPISDGTNIYACFGSNDAACYDLATGKCKWLRFLGAPDRSDWGFSDCHFVPSPRLVKGVLITLQAKMLTGLDAATGRILWQRRHEPSFPDSHFGCGTPVCLRLGDTDVIVTAAGWVVRARDGYVMCRTLGASMDGAGSSPVADDETDTVYLVDAAPGSQPSQTSRRVTAVKLTQTGDNEVTSRILWQGPVGLTAEGGSSLVYHGFLFVKGKLSTCLNTATGSVVPTGLKAFVPHRYSSVCLAGDLLMQFSGTHGGVVRCRPPALELISCNRMAGGTMSPDAGQGEMTVPAKPGKPSPGKPGHEAGVEMNLRRIMDERRENAKQRGIIKWVDLPSDSDGGWASVYGSTPFFHGSRMYVRSRTDLICIGPPEPAAESSR